MLIILLLKTPLSGIIILLQLFIKNICYVLKADYFSGLKIVLNTYELKLMQNLI